MSERAALLMAFVLIVDDEQDLAQLVEFNLRQAGIETAVAFTGAEALAIIGRRKPDLVLLDHMLPDVSGVEVCRTIRANPTTQELVVVMLTAKGEEADRVRGFEAGADDYVVKPFSVRELVLRLKAILRRASPQSDVALEPVQSLGLLKLDPNTHRCSIEGAEVPLTLLEFRLLRFLMERNGLVQSREKLLEEVWGMSSELETRTIDTHVMRLRDKLGPARNYLETVRGIGYRLVQADRR